MNGSLSSVLIAAAFLCGCGVHRPAISFRPVETGREWEIQSALSPKLTEFLRKNPEARTLLIEVYSRAFAERQVRLYYFYSQNESEPRAFHFYRGESFVNIAVRENQEPLDEYISILFETMNSLNAESFSKLAQDAQRGKIGRSEFPFKALEIEHRTVCQIRDLIESLGLAEEEILGSHLYPLIIKSPNRFQDFIAYIQSAPARRNAIQEYLDQYDANVKR